MGRANYNNGYYEGEWKKGSPINGTVYCLGGDKYVGEFKGGKRNGKQISKEKID